MRILISSLTIILIGLMTFSCQNRKNPVNKTQRKSLNQSITIKENSNNLPNKEAKTDSILEYQPDKRESQNLFNGVFDIPELFVAASPEKSNSIHLAQSERIIDFDISPAGLIVAALITDTKDSYIKFWDISQNVFFERLNIEGGFSPKSIVWHPQANALFLVASKNDKFYILRFERDISGWKSENIFSANSQIRRLIICPRPFIISFDRNQSTYVFSYRVFFGLQKEDGSYRIASVTEYGKKFYQVIGPSSTFTRTKFEDRDPSRMESDWALPIAFHPSGQELIWEDSNNNFYKAKYASDTWGQYKKILNGLIKGGSITLTPNGLGFIHWQKGNSGLGLFLIAKYREEKIFEDKLFLSTPSSTPDGKGVVCLTEKNNIQSLEYLTVKYPQSDVVNAWMFSETLEDIDLFNKNYGLFRPLSYDQLYQLYESENYYCDRYDQSVPTRPYLITTDIFWELFGSAFQGIFTVKERAQAIPAFWNFVNSANTHFKNNSVKSPWSQVFETLVSLEKNDPSNPEIKRILASEGKTYSDLLKKEYDYSQLKPRGIYNSSSEMQIYFRAFKYLTTVFEKEKTIIAQLNTLPPEIKGYALEWINSYKEYISPPRRENVFETRKNDIPKYVQYPDTGLSIFPLSWGFDNEALNSTVFHQDYPKDKQIISTSGELRLHPSGLDLASAISSDFAASLLENEYRKYPNLRPVIESLRKNFGSNNNTNENNLYDKWINALSIQWTDTLKSTNREIGNSIWQTKRLQTGLASWATLRHATVLVNETGAAECGEAGFEAILMRAPRGYVEPDPYTLEAIADLFESAIKFIPNGTRSSKDAGGVNNKESTTLNEGITKRFLETAQKIKMFQKIAEKEIKGESISNEEYEEILYIARVAEHNFLIFKSLANEDYALAKPDPIPKITNVFGDSRTGYLMAAVGRPLEWDFTVPYYGRHQIVKGSVYSYYDFVNDKILNDKEWIDKLPSHDYLPWIKPYVSKQNLSSPPQCGF
jgi:hypothetical protein